MIEILNHRFFSAGVTAEVQKMAALEAATFPEQADPAAFGGVWVPKGIGRWEFPTGKFLIHSEEWASPAPLPIHHFLRLEGKEVFLTGVFAGGHVSEGKVSPPFPERRLGTLPRATANSALAFDEFLDYAQAMQRIVFFRDELIGLLEAEITRLRRLPED